MSEAEPRLREVLEESRALGFLGPGPVQTHIEHARGFAAVLEAAAVPAPRAFCDVGSGGGVPGLVLALSWPAARGTLVESMHRRCEFLRRAVDELELRGRIAVVEARAELAAHDGALREQFDVVTARGLAAPAVTAELLVGFVRVGGYLVVSEPPVEDETRWPETELASLGVRGGRARAGTAHFVAFTKYAPTDAAVPRAAGRLTKRPRW